MTRVLVTGASGFVGSHLSQALVEAGHEVLAMTRHPDDYDGPGRAVYGDVSEPDSLREALQGAEAAFRMIVEAFATGNRVALRRLLADGAYAAFEAAITAREDAGETQRSEIRSVDGAEITDAHLRDGVADAPGDPAAPRGWDTAAVLAEVGLTAEEISALIASGAAHQHEGGPP